jgi:ATP-dependent protease ClpP protease subunit
MIQIDNRRGKLKLNDGVHKESADKLIEELDRLYGPAAVAAQMRIGEAVCSAADALESVDVEINSPGGSVFEGQRIYSALREMSARGVEINTTVNGVAASMGSVILMAGDTRSMTRESRIMIHEASTIAMGDAAAMRKAGDLLDGISRDIANIYADRTESDPSAMRDLMRAETWMDAEQAKELGFVHAVVSYDRKKDGKADASFDIQPQGMGILATLFPGNDQVAKLEAAITESESLRADLETAQSRIDELAPLAEVNATLQNEVNDLSAKLADSDRIANESAEKIAELEKQVEAVDEKAATKAAELLAQTGHPAPVSLVGDEGETKSVIDKLESLTGNAKTEFYKANRKAIIAAMDRAAKK